MKLSSPCRFLAATATAALLSVAGHADAAIVSFSFSGVINNIYNPTNALPSGIVLESPFTGTVTYDTSAASADQDPSSQVGDYYFTNIGSFSFTLALGGHTFTCQPLNNGNVFASVNIYHQYQNEDSINLGDTPTSLQMDGAPIPGAADVGGGFGLYLKDGTQTVYNSDALPTVPPQLSAFASAQEINLQAMSDSVNYLFYISGTITNITAVAVAPAPTLVIRPIAGGMVELAWPLTAQGFTLQYTATLANNPAWQTEPTGVIDTATEHTVTVPVSGMKYFRLMK